MTPTVRSIHLLQQFENISIRKQYGVRQRARKEANKVSTQASRRGTKVHQMCEDFINNELDEKKFMPSDRETFNSIKNILSENINNVRVQEATLYSDYLRKSLTISRLYR